jgi:cytidylate kinase
LTGSGPTVAPDGNYKGDATMNVDGNPIKYVPVAYAHRRPEASQMAEDYMRDRVKKQLGMKITKPEFGQIAPTICISRKIGVGALEIADRLAEKIGFHVVERELLDKMARDPKISEDTLAFIKERYPGKITDLASMLFGERSFIVSDYMQNFISAVFTFADMGSTIFVGRGIHLLLPRDKVFAVRFIGSAQYRQKRLSKILDVAEKDARKVLEQVDNEQRDFFKKAFGQKEASPYEFDLVINCDYISRPQGTADVVALAFKEKFAGDFQQTTRKAAAS